MSQLADNLEASLRYSMDSVPFSRWMGMELEAIEDDRVLMAFDMREELIGDPTKRALHGGVISAVLDTVDGFAALLGVLTRDSEQSPPSNLSPWLSTIDMRTDYLRPGVGERFTATAFPQRVGGRLVVTRMELHNDTGALIAVGTGTYVVP